MAGYRDLDVLLVRGRSEPNQIEQLTNEQEGDRTTLAMIVADARQCRSAAESRACTLQGPTRRRCLESAMTEKTRRFADGEVSAPVAEVRAPRSSCRSH
jgi:hypothetical protein